MFRTANAGPWKKLAVRRGAVTKLWTPSPLNPANPYSLCLQLPALLPLITSRTRVVALSACSNLLGTLTPIGEIVAAIREQAKQVGSEGLVVCVDCVAYAPHRRIDVRAWDIDFCVFSLYKVFYSAAITSVQLIDDNDALSCTVHTLELSTSVPRPNLPSLTPHITSSPPLPYPRYNLAVQDTKPPTLLQPYPYTSSLSLMLGRSMLDGQQSRSMNRSCWCRCWDT